MDIVTVGTGGFAREIMYALYSQNIKYKQYRIIGYIDDADEMFGKHINGFEVIGNIEYLLNYKKDIAVLVCIEDPKLKRALVEKLKQNPHIKFPNFICDDCIYHRANIELGEGIIIYYKNIFATDVKLGDFAHINIGNIIGHDVEIGEYTTVAPGSNILGNCKIGKDTYIGSASSVRDYITIGDKCIIGMGSNVLKSIPSSTMAYGNPAVSVKVLKGEEKIFKYEMR